MVLKLSIRLALLVADIVADAPTSPECPELETRLTKNTIHVIVELEMDL
jgi:hypothetical protein